MVDIVPILRKVKWLVLQSVSVAATYWPSAVDESRLVFLVGCGRSGTTIVGQTIGRLRNIFYLNEPLHIWHTIDRDTDCLRFFGHSGKWEMGHRDITDQSRQRARRIFGFFQFFARNRVLVEKLPTNAVRIGWLGALFPKARFVALVRHPSDVVESVVRISTQHEYHIAGMPALNPWWGIGDYKRARMIQEFVGETAADSGVDNVFSDRDCAAIEWLMSIDGIERARRSAELSDRIYVIRYEDFVSHPTEIMTEVAEWIGIGASVADVRLAVEGVRGAGTISGSFVPDDPDIRKRVQEAAACYGYGQ